MLEAFDPAESIEVPRQVEEHHELVLARASATRNSSVVLPVPIVPVTRMRASLANGVDRISTIFRAGLSARSARHAGDVTYSYTSNRW
jgi:hypothetical protein